MRTGKCYGVSVGPGTKDLITVEALDIIKGSDVIFLPTYPREECRAYRIIKQNVKDIDDKELVCEAFLMDPDNKVSSRRHDEICQRVREYLDKGRTVAFLALGEAGLYSTYIYIHERLKKEGYESVIVPGISSVQEICRRLNIPIAKGNEEVHIFPDTKDLKSRLDMPGTKVFMKIKDDIKDVADEIEAAALKKPGMRAYGISECGGDCEIVADDISELKDLKGYFTVIIVKDRADERFAACAEYFENRACGYYPCHKGIDRLNCLFCYCPMYNYEDCPGTPSYIKKGDKSVKNCTSCSFPHIRENHAFIMEFLRSKKGGFDSQKPLI